MLKKHKYGRDVDTYLHISLSFYGEKHWVTVTFNFTVSVAYVLGYTLQQRQGL
jgi:hypothetical protein